MRRSNRWGTISRAYAYQLYADGTEDYQAFHDLESRDSWVMGSPGRYPIHACDMNKFQRRAAQWWTDTLIGG